MKPANTSPKFPLSPEAIAAAIAAAPERVDDPECPYDPNDPAAVAAFWEGARVKRRGPQKAPTKVPTTIRFDADVLAALKASGKGWQTRVNQVMREWIAKHPRG